MFRNYVFISVLVLLAALAPFFFPWPFALGVGIIVSLFFPPAVFLTGALIDLLYANSHSGFPYFAILGAVLAAVFFFVHQFMKTRIIS